MRIKPFNIYVMSADKAMELMPEGYIDLTVTSCPYDDLRTCYEYNFPFEKIAKQLYRVTKPGGIVCWNVNSSTDEKGSETLTPFKQAIYFVEECGFILHDTMIYQKLNFSHPEKRRYQQVFEFLFILSKGRPETFNPLMDRPNKTAGKVGSLGINSYTKPDGTKGRRAKKVNKPFGMRHNVWLGKTRGQEEMCKKLKHRAMMPKWLAKDLILSFSNVGDIVYDPMAGSGTTAKQAQLVGRKWRLSELSKQFALDSLDEIPAQKHQIKYYSGS